MVKLNPDQLKDLSDELAALTKKQSDARQTAEFVGMNHEETKAFDLRAERMSKIYVVLSENDAKR